MRFVSDCKAGPDDIGFWRWIKGPRYKLEVGKQAWELSYKAGARVDRMVLTPDLAWAPEGNEIGPPVVVQTEGEYVATTSPIRPRSLEKWLRVDYISNPVRGKIVVEASVNGGKSFVEVRDADLSGLPVKGDGGDSLVLRFTMKPGPRGHSPVMQSVKVAYLSSSRSIPPDLSLMDKELVYKSNLIPLVPMRGVGFRAIYEGRRLRIEPAGELYQPDARGRFRLEAESATLLSAYPSNEATATVEGAQGKALYIVPTRPHIAVYDLDVPAEAQYAVYFRVRQARRNLKLKPRLGYAFRVDEREDYRGHISTSSVGVDGWVWAKGSGTLKLRSGARRLEWLGGLIDLWADSLCLVPLGAPEPESVGGGASPRVPVRESVVEFFPLYPPEGGRWEGIEAEGLAELKVSLDGGESWSKPPAELGAGELRIRARVTGPATLAVRFRSPKPLLQLGDSRIEALFELTGRLYGLFHRGRGEWVAAPGTRSSPFTITYQVPGVARLYRLQGGEGRLLSVSGDSRRLLWKTELLDGQMRVEQSVKSGETTIWRIKVTNNSEFDIRSVRFPVLGRLTLGGIRSDDTILFPQAFGAPLPQPYHRSRYSYRPIIWPGTASMAWLDLSDGDGGLYLSAYHTDMLGVEFDTGGNPDRASIRMGYRKQVCISKGESWTGDYALLAHSGDWHTASDHYRR